MCSRRSILLFFRCLLAHPSDCADLLHPTCTRPTVLQTLYLFLLFSLEFTDLEDSFLIRLTVYMDLDPNIDQHEPPILIRKSQFRLTFPVFLHDTVSFRLKLYSYFILISCVWFFLATEKNPDPM